jgi:hypothetical protein
MQVGGKDDDTGWGVYEEARRGGALVATAHEHSYSRTHPMASFELQHVSSSDDVIRLQRDLPSTSADDGRSFAFVSGMGGRSIRGQELAGDWWAAIYTSDQGAEPGALFCTFNPGGSRPRDAECWFEDVAGVIPDAFGVRTRVLERRTCGTLGIEVVPLLLGLFRRRLRRA